MVRQRYLIGGQWDMCIGVLTGSLVENGQSGMAILVVAHPSGFLRPLDFVRAQSAGRCAAMLMSKLEGDLSG